MNRNRNSSRAGFSLMEMTLVLVIMGVLMAIALPYVLGQGEKAKRKATFASMDNVANALTNYNLDHSSYPTTLGALTATKPPYLDPRKPPKDGWTREFAYQVPGINEHPYELLSAGADGKFNSPDDLDVWKPDTK